MSEIQQQALRASGAIHEALTDVQHSRPVVGLPDAAWDRCRDLIRQMKKATSRQWHRAADRLREHLRRALDDLRRQVDQSLYRIDTRDPTETRATRHDVFRDLVALGDEFDDVDICLKTSNVSAVTGAIVLEGTDLGRFRIELCWDELGQQQPYTVVAIDPNPAASHSDTTHPHVQDRQLCEGDGRTPIQRALQQGRLLDFFIMVRQILETYNSGSAYVQLEDWHGIDCHDCGRLAHGDDRLTCEQCEADLCYECSTGCPTCDRRCCGRCIASCSACEEFFCSRCLSRCAACQQYHCEECLTYEKCEKCRKAEAAKNDERKAETASAGTAVHAVCLGEAAVPARPG